MSLKLAKYYPLPNFPGNSRNYSAPIITVANSRQHQRAAEPDAQHARTGSRGGIGYQGSNNTTPNIFGFVDTPTDARHQHQRGWSHNFTTRLISNLNYRFSRSRSLATPYFSNRRTWKANWASRALPPMPIELGSAEPLVHAGHRGLSDGAAKLSRNQTSAVGESVIWIHNPHNMTFGADYRRQQINPLSDANARGAFTFTGTVTSQIVNGVAVQGTGFDFADFLLGSPDTSSVNFGNADKYFRTLGLRRVRQRRLAHEHQVQPERRDPLGLPGAHHRAVQPPGEPGYRAGISARSRRCCRGRSGRSPASVSGLAGEARPQQHSRRGFGFALAALHQALHPHQRRLWHLLQLARLTPRSRTTWRRSRRSPQNFSVAIRRREPADDLDTFAGLSTVTNTRAIDPNYRIGYAQIWQLSVQNDLGALAGGHADLEPHQGHAPGPAVPAQFPAPGIDGRCRPRAGGLHLRAVERQLHFQFGAGAGDAPRPQRDFGNITYMFSKGHRRWRDRRR